MKIDGILLAALVGMLFLNAICIYSDVSDEFDTIDSTDWRLVVIVLNMGYMALFVLPVVFKFAKKIYTKVFKKNVE